MRYTTSRVGARGTLVYGAVARRRIKSFTRLTDRVERRPGRRATRTRADDGPSYEEGLRSITATRGAIT